MGQSTIIFRNECRTVVIDLLKKCLTSAIDFVLRFTRRVTKCKHALGEVDVPLHCLIFAKLVSVQLLLRSVLHLIELLLSDLCTSAKRSHVTGSVCTSRTSRGIGGRSTACNCSMNN